MPPIDDGKEGKEKDDTIIFQNDEVSYESSRLLLQLVNDFLTLVIPSDFRKRRDRDDLGIFYRKC